MQTIKSSAFFNPDFLCISLKITKKQKISCFIRISMNNLSAKVLKMHEICKFMRKYFVI